MAKKNDNVLARIQFTADKMLPKMKKCLEKKDLDDFKLYPAIEMETGVMLATTGHVLAAHKLKDYTFSPSDGAMLGEVVTLPVEVLKMKGRVDVTVAINGYDTIVTAKDEKGTTGEVHTTVPYPKWRTAIPRTTGYAIGINAKEWDAILKEIMAKLHSTNYPISLHAEQGSNTMSVNWENIETDESGTKNVNVGSVPFKIGVSMNAKYLRDLLAMEPTEMRFMDSTRAVIFLNDETLCLQMPLLGYDEGITVENCFRETFDLEKWIGADLGEIVVDNRKTELSLTERLREALLKQLGKAA